MIELEEKIVQACKDAQAKGIKITQSSSLLFNNNREPHSCCALVATNIPTYQEWLEKDTFEHVKAGLALGLTYNQIARFVAGFDSLYGVAEDPYYLLGRRVAKRVLP